MAATIPTTVPATLPAGIDWQWTWSSSDYAPADVTTLTFYFTGAASFNIAATAGSSDFSVAVASTTTADYTAGTYKWTAVATVSGIDYQAEAGVIVITPSVKATGDQRTHAEKMVSLIEDEIEARITGDGSGHESYAIGGAGSRSIAKLPIEKLEAMLARYRAQVDQERNGGVLPPYEVRFVRP